VTVEFQGFSKFAQENVLLQSRGDVSVNVTLKAGDVKETVTVSAEASVVQFNTAKLETTVDSRLTNNLPRSFARRSSCAIRSGGGEKRLRFGEHAVPQLGAEPAARGRRPEFH